MFAIAVDGATKLEGEFIAKSLAVTPAVRSVITYTAQRLQLRIVANASGRPGPRRVSGDYVRSWNTILKFDWSSAEADIGTNMPQARRLEHGFTGRDALGRFYNQPALPHVVPAVDTTKPEFERGMARVQAEAAE